MLEQRAHEAIDVMRGRREMTDVFDAHFLAKVSAQQFRELAKQLQAANGKVVEAEHVRPLSSATADFRIRFERAFANADLTLASAEPRKVTGLRIDSAIPLDDTPTRIAADFAALPGRAGFAVVKLGDEAAVTIQSGHADERFAIGSAFKLWVLEALADDIAAGRRRWDEVVRLGPRSLPGGITQDWPAEAPATVETLATLMISQSDNTATDTLMRLIGRDRIAGGLSRPVLTTAEAFALKLGPADVLEAYTRADEAGRAKLLETTNAAKVLAEADATALDGRPVAIDSAEWFATPAEVVAVLDRLRRHGDPRVLAILGVAPQLGAGERNRFTYAGYKGGSESGVLNLSWLLRDNTGAWFAVTASWNDPARDIDKARLETLAARLIAAIGAPRQLP